MRYCACKLSGCFLYRYFRFKIDETYNFCYTIICMSNTYEDKNNKNKDLEKSQNNQKVVGDASENPETSGPAENLREEAAKATDNSNNEKEPA